MLTRRRGDGDAHALRIPCGDGDRGRYADRRVGAIRARSVFRIFRGRTVAKSAAAKFDIADLNPIRLIYDEVMKQVATDANRPSFAVGTPVPVADFSKMDAQIKLNNERFQRMSGSGTMHLNLRFACRVALLRIGARM
jgi:hypothetical protein